MTFLTEEEEEGCSGVPDGLKGGVPSEVKWGARWGEVGKLRAMWGVRWGNVS